MIDTGLASIPSNWSRVPIGQIADTAAGGTPKRGIGAYYDGEIPWVKSGELRDGIVYAAEESITELGLQSSNAKLFPKGTVCIALYGATIGKAAILEIDAATNQAVCGIFLPPQIDRRYFFYFLLSIRHDLIALGQGGAQSNISNELVRQTSLALAPEAEQTRIADRIEELFTDLDAGVAALERVQKKLKRYRSAVLHAAVTGRLTEAWRKEHGPPAESGEQLLERLLVERRRQWEERTLADYEAKGKKPPKNWQQRYKEPVDPDTADLPELPEGWCWASMDQAFQTVRNGTATVPRQEEGIPILRISAVRPLRVELDDVRYLTPVEADDANAWLDEDDLLFTRYNGSAHLCGVCGRVTAIQRPTAHPDKLICCRVVSSEFSAGFIEIAANAGPTRSIIESKLRTTAGQVGVSGSDIKVSALPLPPPMEQAEIIEKVQEKLSQIDAMEIEVSRGLARASRLRQTVLKAAFAGELVEQDPNDEPASVLLDRIRAEREAMASKSNGRPKRSPRKKAAPKKRTKAAKKTTTKKKAGKS